MIKIKEQTVLRTGIELKNGRIYDKDSIIVAIKEQGLDGSGGAVSIYDKAPQSIIVNSDRSFDPILGEVSIIGAANNFKFIDNSLVCDVTFFSNSKPNKKFINAVLFTAITDITNVAKTLRISSLEASDTTPDPNGLTKIKYEKDSMME